MACPLVTQADSLITGRNWLSSIFRSPPTFKVLGLSNWTRAFLGYACCGANSSHF
jgi:hypothetical protein